MKLLDYLLANTSILFIAIGILLIIIASIIYLRARKRLLNPIPPKSDIKNRHGFQRRNKEYRKSQQWKELREAALKRANYVCELCGKPAQVVHHKIYPSNFKDDSLDNLLVLCNKCHYNIHKQQIKYKNKESLFAESIISGNQHFRIQVRKARNQSKYIVLSELRADEDGRADDIKIVIFRGNIGRVIKGLTKALKFINNSKN